MSMNKNKHKRLIKNKINKKKYNKINKLSSENILFIKPNKIIIPIKLIFINLYIFVIYSHSCKEYIIPSVLINAA